MNEPKDPNAFPPKPLPDVEQLFELFKAGKISSKEFKQRTGNRYTIKIAGKKDYSKYSAEQLREIRKTHR